MIIRFSGTAFHRAHTLTVLPHRSSFTTALLTAMSLSSGQSVWKQNCGNTEKASNSTCIPMNRMSSVRNGERLCAGMQSFSAHTSRQRLALYIQRRRHSVKSCGCPAFLLPHKRRSANGMTPASRTEAKKQLLSWQYSGHKENHS